MKNPYQVVHTPCAQLRKKLHVILVRPAYGGNVGSTARAIANMGLLGRFVIVGDRSLYNEECFKFAKHAKNRLEAADFAPTLKDALKLFPEKRLSLAATARIGSSDRPHPIAVREAMVRATEKLKSQEIEDLVFVFGPEDDGLSNEEVAQCDWIATIPSSPEYRSLNLSQSVLIFSYEANMCFQEALPEFQPVKTSQKQKIVEHLIALAKEAGFILPGDPYKMQPRLEEILSALPKHIKDANTLHGLIAQVRRSVVRGEAEIRGRYRTKLLKGTNNVEQRTE